MSSDTWSQLQAHKRKQESLKERLFKRRRERKELIDPDLGSQSPHAESSSQLEDSESSRDSKPLEACSSKDRNVEIDENLEKRVLQILLTELFALPVSVSDIFDRVAHTEELERMPSITDVTFVLEKLAAQALLTLKKKSANVVVTECEHAKLEALLEEHKSESQKKGESSKASTGDKLDAIRPSTKATQDKGLKDKDVVMSLLAMPTMKEKENRKLGEEIIELLNQPTAKEISLMEKFKSQGGTSVKEFCLYGTREECKKQNIESSKCNKLHFKKILQKHTDETLGDCSFLNTCFHMDTCKYVHYEIDYSACPGADSMSAPAKSSGSGDAVVAVDRQKIILFPPQWVQCDIRKLDMEILGKFSVVMADPPWDIHMELPYGTMSDDEMRNLNVPQLQDDGYIFLWVTGRAMELGRECLERWGYQRCDEIIWVKTNQLQRLIRTGRTGHWINHGKEHCLVGVKGNPMTGFNKGMDCDVLVSEVRDTSHKPDEIYGLIERLAPGTRKIELFGRQHNVQPNWITLGNQLRGVNLLDPEVVVKFKEKYPDGNCLLTNS